jgi:hypothetical protein
VCPATAPKLYFSTLQPTFYSHTEDVKYEEQAIPYNHVLTNKNKMKAKWTLTSYPNYIFEGGSHPQGASSMFAAVSKNEQ